MLTSAGKGASKLSETKSYETVLVTQEGRIVTLALNRPEKKNAMSPKMHEEMFEIIQRLASDDEVGVLILTGTGDSFSSGEDLKEFFAQLETNPDRDRIRWLANQWRGHLLRLFPKPTIAAVNGYCFGGAFVQLGSCDLAFAADEAQFCLSEINLGGIPAGLVTKMLTDALLPRQALYYMMTGERFGGKRAEQIGLVNRSVPLAELTSAVHELAEVLLQKSPAALRATKEAFKMGQGMDFETSFQWLNAKSQALRAQNPREPSAFATGEWRGTSHAK